MSIIMFTTDSDPSAIVTIYSVFGLAMYQPVIDTNTIQIILNVSILAFCVRFL